MTGFENRVLQTIRKFEMLAGDKSVAVALSGGPDSVALLIALLKIRGVLKFGLSAIHYHHNLRGQEADRDERYVRDLCRDLDVPLRVGRRKSAGVPSGNLEDQLRRSRYSYFRKELGDSDTCLATGHSLDDQAETVILKLVRGAGPRGLAGIYPVRWYDDLVERQLKVIRPLLQVTRRQVLEYLRERTVDYCSDSSNLDSSFDRNFVRQRLLPTIRDRLNPQVAGALGRTADLHRNLVEVIRDKADDFLRKHSQPQAEGLSVECRALAQESPFWRSAFLREAAHRVTMGNELGTRHLAQIEALLDLQTGRRFNGPGALEVWKERDRIIFTKASDALDFEIQLSIPGEIFVKETGHRIRAKPGPVGKGRDRPILLEFSGNRLTVRSLQKGDRIRYASRGRNRLRKVAELLTEKQFPLRQRRRLVVLSAPGEVLWVEGLGTAADRVAGSREEPLVCIDVEKTSATLDPARVLK